MAMNRSQLRNIIDSGRAIALDFYAISREIPNDDPVGRLFKTDLLNKTVLMKRYEAALPTARQDVIVNTLVYFPYDFENPYDGGEVLTFGDANFSNAFEFKITQRHNTQAMDEAVKHDLERLQLLDSIHSLDPFLLRCRAEKFGVANTIHERYFMISDNEWESIRVPIREKISRLVSKALGKVDADHDLSIREHYIERFLSKIWEAKDIQGIEPFVRALQIAPAKAPEVFFAWKAVCYYHVRFRALQAELNKMFQWVGSNRLCYPSDSTGEPNAEQKLIIARREKLRHKMRVGYQKACDVIDDYERSYNRFVEDGRPQAFVGFLLNSENVYMNLASHVSVATHSINVWQWYMEQYGMELRHAQFVELFDGLTMLYGVEQADRNDDDIPAFRRPPKVLDFTKKAATH